MKRACNIIFMIVLVCMFSCGCSKGKNKTNVVENPSVAGALELDIEKGRFGFVDESGKLVIDYKYDYAEPFSEGLALVKKDSGYGFINERGEECIQAEYTVAHSFSDGLALVSKDNKYRYINKDGEVAFEMDYEDAEPFSEGLASVALTRGEGSKGYIDTNGKLVIPCIYDYTTSFSEGLAFVKKDDVRQYIDKTGQVVLEVDNILGSEFSEGLASVAKNGGYDGWGFIDKSGNEVIPCDYRHTTNFSDGLAAVEYQSGSIYEDCYGYINKNGELQFGGYEYADPFYNGYAVVDAGDVDNSKTGIIDKNNNVILPFEYEAIIYVTHDEETGIVLYEVKEGEFYHYAVINSKGLRNFD